MLKDLLAALVAQAPRSAFLFVYALLFALVEIEIEGPNGWAADLPTWYRVRPWYARVFSFLLSGKPLTGYHAIMFFVPLASFHVGLAFGQPWSLGLEARLIASYLLWAAVWDFLWFLWNPHYGLRRFRKGEIWWHNKIWVGRIPIDYVNALWSSFVVAAVPWMKNGKTTLLTEHLAFTLEMASLVLIAALLAPLYHLIYRRMHRPEADERALVLK